jgi:hypothetical protein
MLAVMAAGTLLDENLAARDAGYVHRGESFLFAREKCVRRADLAGYWR